MSRDQLSISYHSVLSVIPFNYSNAPLLLNSPSIRLVDIFPAKGDAADLHCAISVVSLDDGPVYEALSYAWGDTTRSCPITLEGARLMITSNLDIALRHLRDKDEVKPFWIDAICINQEDIDERSRQVGQMRMVFERAERVVVWLGEERDQSAKAMARVEATAESFQASVENFLCRVGENSSPNSDIMVQIYGAMAACIAKLTTGTELCSCCADHGLREHG
jgi:hypothetical protein